MVVALQRDSAHDTKGSEFRKRLKARRGVGQFEFWILLIAGGIPERRRISSGGIFFVMRKPGRMQLQKLRANG